MPDAALGVASSVETIAKLLPLIIADATLLAMVNARNSDLATRFRNNVAEARKRDTPWSRKINLQCQNLIFLLRYCATSASFIAFAVSMTCIAMYGLKLLTTTADAQLAVIIDNVLGWFGIRFNSQEFFTSDAGITWFLYGLVTLVLEFAIGFTTLVFDGVSSFGLAGESKKGS